MGGLLNTLLKRTALVQCPCSPGIVATALEQLSGVTSPDFTLNALAAYDPVLTVRLECFQAAADASAALADPTPLLRAMLLLAPVAEGAQLPQYAECWQCSLKVDHLTRALAKRSGLVLLEIAWLTGLTHNLASYGQPVLERVARIVRGVTDVEDVRPAENVERVSVSSVVSELVRMTINTLLVPNKISVQIDLNPEVQPMPLQKDQLKQVLFNLAKNAVEAMGQGGYLTFTARLVHFQGIRQWKSRWPILAPAYLINARNHI